MKSKVGEYKGKKLVKTSQPNTIEDWEILVIEKGNNTIEDLQHRKEDGSLESILSHSDNSGDFNLLVFSDSSWERSRTLDLETGEDITQYFDGEYRLTNNSEKVSVLDNTLSSDGPQLIYKITDNKNYYSSPSLKYTSMYKYIQQSNIDIKEADQEVTFANTGNLRDKLSYSNYLGYCITPQPRAENTITKLVDLFNKLHR